MKWPIMLICAGALAGCSTSRVDAPDVTLQVPVEYQELGACMIDALAGKWPTSIRVENTPDQNRVRISYVGSREGRPVRPWIIDVLKNHPGAQVELTGEERWLPEVGLAIKPCI